MTNAYDLKDDVNVQRFQQETGLDDFVNTFAVKGPIIVVGRWDHYLWTDRKTSDYVNKGIAGKLVFRGSNWRSREDATPWDVFRKQLAEETKKSDENTTADATNPLQKIILEGAIAFRDYFTAIPKRLLGNPDLPHAWYCDFSSIYFSEITERELREQLSVPKNLGPDGIEKALNSVSPDSIQRLTPFRSLYDRSHLPFGFGDDHKMRDILASHYGIRKRMMRMTIDVEVIALPTRPTLPFSAREGQLKYLRQDNNPLLEGNVTRDHVFQAREG